MLLSSLQAYIDAASDNTEIGISICSYESDEEIALSFDVVADINEHGELIFSIGARRKSWG